MKHRAGFSPAANKVWICGNTVWNPFEFRRLLVHELVHAFQFDLMNRNFLPQMNARTLPLWMMEGMAEWVSNGVDPVTAMWVMDAQLVQGLVRELPGHLFPTGYFFAEESCMLHS